LDESDRMSNTPIFSSERPVTFSFTLTFESDL
jgi:hypothetical protein